MSLNKILKKCLTLVILMMVFFSNYLTIRTISAEEPDIEETTDVNEQNKVSNSEDKEELDFETDSSIKEDEEEITTTENNSDVTTLSSSKGVIASGVCGDNVTYTLYDDYSLVLSGTGKTYSYDYTKDTFAPWDNYRTSIKSIIVEDGITHLGNSIFFHCSNVTKIEMPKSVIYIDIYALSHCDGILSAGPKGGGYNYEFEWDEEIAPFAFSGLYGLKTLVIPEGVKTIKYNAVTWCMRLESVTLPSTLETIGSRVFSNCSYLKSIFIPSRVSSIGEDVFSSVNKNFKATLGCGSNLTDEQLAKALITNYTKETHALKHFERVEPTKQNNGNIEYWMCENCNKYFSDASANEEITAEEIVLHYGKGIIASGICGDNVTYTVYDDYSMVISGTGAMENYSENVHAPYSSFKNKLTSIVIEDGVTNIGNCAFSGCSSLTSITIPDSVTSIGYSAFYGCKKLQSITIPDSVKSIGTSAFSGGCTSLASVHLGNSLISIGDKAFLKCTALTSITIPDSVKSIGVSAFNGCTSLTSINIPDSVTSIGYHAFNGCTSLETIYIPNSVTELGTDVFTECSALMVTIGCDSPLTDEDLANAGVTSYVREDHDLVHVESVKPTEDNSGNIEYWYCTRCGKCFADSDGTQEIDIEDTVIKNEDYGDIIPEDRPLTPSLIPNGIWLSTIDDVEYDPLNKTYTPSFRVYDHTRILNKSTDYNVSFKNNSKAGTASVTVTGKGDYTGTYTGYFNILPKQLDDEFKVVLNNDSFRYANGKVLRPTVSVEYKGVKLKDKTDYTVSYENINSKNPGHYSVNIKGNGNYEGTLTASYQIMESESDLIPISSIKISSIKKMTYTGDPLVQDLVLTNGKTTLKKGTDYEVDYYDNIDAGTAYITILGIGDYTGSITKSFKIDPLKLTTKNTSIDKLPVSLEYEGKALRPDIDVYLDGKILLDEDYTLTYTNNINVGTAKITVKGTGNYSGTITKNFKIVKKEIPEQSISVADDFAYEKGGVMPVPEIIIDGTELVYNKDFTVSYKNNKAVNDGSNIAKTPMMTITGKGNYTGKYEYYFTIHEKDISEVDIIVPDKIYSNKANAYKSTPVLTDTNGKKLSAGTDYDKNYDYFIDDKPVTGIPSPGSTVTVKVTGKGNYKGSVIGEYRIVSYDIAKAKVTIPVQYYTGRPIKPSYDDITVTFNKIQLSKDDYEIVSYTNNINKGTAKLTIKGKGQYGGTKTINFTIKQRSLGNTIHFNLNGGSGTLNDQLIYKDTALSNYNGKKTVNGIIYTFKGWSTVLNGDIVYRNKQLFTYDPKMAGKTVTLYAVWGQ